MTLNVGDVFEYNTIEWQVTAIDYQLQAVHSRRVSSGLIISFDFAILTGITAKTTAFPYGQYAPGIDLPLSALKEMYNTWGPAKCECGTDKTYGEKTGEYLHSPWCPKYRPLP